MTLSLCMIVKNEEDVLERALQAVTFADEIIVVDTGSTDGTKAVAEKYTDKIFDFKWRDDFAAARNFAIEKATCDYWMWLDADDVIPVSTARGIASIMKSMDGSTDAVMLPYSLGCDDKGKPLYTFYRERILKNGVGFKWRGRVHEAVPLRGNVVRAPYSIVHSKPQGKTSGTRNLDIYRKMKKEGEHFGPRETYYYARELYHNGEYSSAADEFEKFLTMKGGFLPNIKDAHLMLSKAYTKLGKRDRALNTLLKSLAFGEPSGEIACEIGLAFFSRGDYKTAAYWFERAASSKPDRESGAFIDMDCYGFLPSVWLTVCYDRLGKTRAAYYWHTRARKLRPDHPSVIANEAYFKGLNFPQKAGRKT